MKKVNSSELVNWWLKKFHNTTIEEQTEIRADDDSRKFYNDFRVTQEQHDEWEAWAKDHVKKVTKVSKKVLEHSWWSVYLNTSPAVITRESE